MTERDEYTPTWFEIRERVEHDTYLTADEADAWLAEHDAKVRAEALREAEAQIRPTYRLDYVVDRSGGPVDDPTLRANRALHRAADKVRCRANRIEREAGLK